MIVKHQAYAVNEKKQVCGYAAYINHNFVIFSEDGNMVVVDEESLTPIFETQEREENLQKGGRFPISECSEISKYLKRMLANIEIFYLEDLQEWTDKDYAKLRSVGPARQRKIQELLERLNLKYNGTDYLSKDLDI